RCTRCEVRGMKWSPRRVRNLPLPFSIQSVNPAKRCSNDVLQLGLCSNKLSVMPSTRAIVRRRLKNIHRNLRGARMIAGAFASTDHPLLAHIIPIRRCNLACEYCNEFDDFSKPVPTETMFQRVDKLAELGTSVI